MDEKYSPDSFSPKTKQQLRCVCSRKPLLAIYGLNQNDEPYLHVLIKKQQRVFGELLFQTPGARAELKCRDCYRWTRVLLSGRRVSASVRDSDPFTPADDPK